MPFFLRLVLPVMLFVLMFTYANAHEYEKGDLLIEHPHIPAPAKGSPVSAGYVIIHNKGAEDEVLLDVKSSFSERSQIHTMVVVDDVARMRPVKDGVIIPAGGSVKLEQGGLHLMFMRMAEKLEAGQFKNVTLTFQNAGKIEIGMLVIDPAELDENEHSQHGSHSDHSGHSSD